LCYHDTKLLQSSIRINRLKPTFIKEALSMSALTRWLSVVVCVAFGGWTPGMCVAQQARLALEFATYLGGSGGENFRDVVVDANSNIYVTGGTSSSDFPTTPGAYDRTFATGGSDLGSAGPMDVFVSKFSPSGQLVWSTYLGGPNYDRAYAIEVDAQGHVYLAGRAGPGFPTSPGVLQPNFAGDSGPAGAYGKQDGFVAKLSPDGSQLLWATYFGEAGGGFIRDLDIDSARRVCYRQHVLDGFPYAQRLRPCVGWQR
jgi:hypothetical protein